MESLDNFITWLEERCDNTANGRLHADVVGKHEDRDPAPEQCAFAEELLEDLKEARRQTRIIEGLNYLRSLFSRLPHGPLEPEE